ncbi:MAG: hypothetical protein JXO44_01645 [Clostridia bacterium]|nr:hypothetical protein [Clostridia bacterium]
MRRKFPTYEDELEQECKKVIKNAKCIHEKRCCVFEHMKQLGLSKEDINELLKKGYEHMAGINQTIAENGLIDDVSALNEYEKELNKARNSSEH